jgi:hypothetical protein
MTVNTKEVESYIGDLAMAFQWLSLQGRTCWVCFSGCVKAMEEVRLGPVPLQDGHHSWMCQDCRAALDAEVARRMDEINALLAAHFARDAGASVHPDVIVH